MALVEPRQVENGQWKAYDTSSNKPIESVWLYSYDTEEECQIAIYKHLEFLCSNSYSYRRRAR